MLKRHSNSCRKKKQEELENNLIERSTTDSDGSSIECRPCVVAVVVGVAFVYKRIRLPNRVKTKRKEEPTKSKTPTQLHMHNWLKLKKLPVCIQVTQYNSYSKKKIESQ